MSASSDPRVVAVRADATIGRGTCSSVDECFTDEEVIARLDEEGITTPDGAVEEMRFLHDIWADTMAEAVAESGEG